jgi:NAD(P)-dependent dehydrogenase (short-subunit alcohol dehydrogenase family)
MYPFGSEAELKMKPLMQRTPLAQARKGVDAEAWVEYADEYGGRPAFGSEIAGVVGMLCTADAAWCTGSVVNANGGMVMNK